MSSGMSAAVVGRREGMQGCGVGIFSSLFNGVSRVPAYMCLGSWLGVGGAVWVLCGIIDGDMKFLDFLDLS